MATRMPVKRTKNLGHQLNLAERGTVNTVAMWPEWVDMTFRTEPYPGGAFCESNRHPAALCSSDSKSLIKSRPCPTVMLTCGVNGKAALNQPLAISTPSSSAARIVKSHFARLAVRGRFAMRQAFRCRESYILFMPPSPPRIADLEKMLAAEPNDAFLLYALAQEHAKAGNFAEAIAAYDRCLAADPNYFYAYFHKARAQQSTAEAGGMPMTEAIATLKAGLAAARKGGRGGDAKAMSEIQGFLDELE